MYILSKLSGNAHSNLVALKLKISRLFCRLCTKIYTWHTVSHNHDAFCHICSIYIYIYHVIFYISSLSFQVAMITPTVTGTLTRISPRFQPSSALIWSITTTMVIACRCIRLRRICLKNISNAKCKFHISPLFAFKLNTAHYLLIQLSGFQCAR